MLEGLNAVEDTDYATGERSDESACLALTIMCVTYLRADMRDLWLRQIGRPS
jgi:hypothetical protein